MFSIKKIREKVKPKGKNNKSLVGMSGNIPIQGQKDWRQNYCYYVKTKIQRAKSNLNKTLDLKFLEQDWRYICSN